MGMDTQPTPSSARNSELGQDQTEIGWCSLVQSACFESLPIGRWPGGTGRTVPRYVWTELPFLPALSQSVEREEPMYC